MDDFKDEIAITKSRIRKDTGFANYEEWLIFDKFK